MTYNQVKHLKPSEFKRLCGVQPETFKRMIEVVNQTHQQLKPGIGQPVQIDDRRPSANDIGVFTGVPHLLSYSPIMGS